MGGGGYIEFDGKPGDDKKGGRRRVSAYLREAYEASASLGDPWLSRGKGKSGKKGQSDGSWAQQQASQATYTVSQITGDGDGDDWWW